VAGAEVGDLDLACTIIEARVRKCMREGVTGEWRESQAAVPMVPGWRVERETMGLGFGTGAETVRLENRDRGGDSDSLRFYVAITLPQMPLFEIDVVVNLFSTRRAKERHLIFGVCWWDCFTRCEIKFSGHVGRTAWRGAQQRPEFIPYFNRN
jgi:hypothetical protein